MSLTAQYKAAFATILMGGATKYSRRRTLVGGGKPNFARMVAAKTLTLPSSSHRVCSLGQRIGDVLALRNQLG